MSQISTKHLTTDFVNRLLASLNTFIKEEGDMDDLLFIMTEKDNPIAQMLTGKFTFQLVTNDNEHNTRV